MNNSPETTDRPTPATVLDALRLASALDLAVVARSTLQEIEDAATTLDIKPVLTIGLYDLDRSDELVNIAEIIANRRETEQC